MSVIFFGRYLVDRVWFVLGMDSHTSASKGSFRSCATPLSLFWWTSSVEGHGVHVRCSSRRTIPISLSLCVNLIFQNRFHQLWTCTEWPFAITSKAVLLRSSCATNYEKDARLLTTAPDRVLSIASKATSSCAIFEVEIRCHMSVVQRLSNPI